LSGYSPRTEYTEAFARANTDQILDKCLHHDMTVYLPSLLHLEDRLSMAVSLESRVPLLDHHIVEFLATVPPHEKVRGEQPKYLLRTLSSRLVPDEIWQNREKRGFPVPGSFWRTPELGELVRRVLLSRECLDRGIFARDSLVAAASSADITVLWPLVNVELWFKIFVDEDPEWVQKATGAAVALQQL
jgi:asparagine synthase (glutamine-hydrolysing)